MTLNLPLAGHLSDIRPLANRGKRNNRLVAPISTVLYAPKSFRQAPTNNGIHGVQVDFNIPTGQNWTDLVAPDTVVLVQTPSDNLTAAILGDIMASRLKIRGLAGVVINGRVRDLATCSEMCEDGSFHMWAKGVSAASPTLEIIPWAVGTTLRFGTLEVKPGDILCADEGDQAVVIIPQERLDRVLELLKVQKVASEGVIQKVKNGARLPDAVRQHPDFYSAKNY